MLWYFFSYSFIPLLLLIEPFQSKELSQQMASVVQLQISVSLFWFQDIQKDFTLVGNNSKV